MGIPQVGQYFVIALTGGIASGKSTVSGIFEKLGAPVVDTDEISRLIVTPGSPALSEIESCFGASVITIDGNLDRRTMRNIIFSDSNAKGRLEAILHPAILAQARKQLFEIDAPYSILVVPLLSESSNYDWVDRVLVVDVPEEIQIERVMSRDRIDREQAERILRSQASRDERLALADDVIANTGSIPDLESAVTKLHRKYLDLAKARNQSS